MTEGDRWCAQPHSSPPNGAYWGSAGGVELQGLRHPGLDLLDPSRFRRVGGQVLGWAVTPLCGLGHPIPEVEHRVRVVTCLGHEDQAEMVGLRLLGAAPG